MVIGYIDYGMEIYYRRSCGKGGGALGRLFRYINNWNNYNKLNNKYTIIVLSLAN